MGEEEEPAVVGSPSAMREELAVAGDVAEGLARLLTPVIHSIDGSLQAAQLSQSRLRQQLAALQQGLSLSLSLLVHS